MGEGAIETVPQGYRLVDVPPGTVFDGEELETFGMTATRVTNPQWGELVDRLEGDVFVLLDHDRRTGETQIVQTGHDIELPERSKEVEWDKGEVFLHGAQVLLKMAANPSAQFDERGRAGEADRIFSGARQPVVGLSFYFHPIAYCLLLNRLSGEGAEWLFTLLTDAQYGYVATNRGNPEWKYPTANGKLFDGRRKLLHVDEYKNGRGTTAAVDDKRYVQDLPFGIQAGGNVWTPTLFDKKHVPERLTAPAEPKRDDGVIRMGADVLTNAAEPFHPAAYGLRGGSWGSGRGFARASVRISDRPWDRGGDVGFSAAAVRARTAFRAR